MKYFSAALLCLTISLFAQTPAGFTDVIKLFNYPEISAQYSELEQTEFGKISFTPKINYPDKLIRLYLLASGITDTKDFNLYLAQFEKLFKKSLSDMNGKKLNDYNRAEFILHFLHKNLFKKVIEGTGAGFNIGIRDTLSSGLYNCYRSALIYNALMEYHGYKTYLVLVPDHIYSVVEINNKQIDVETTNQFGYDPFNKGLPEFKRLFDEKNIMFRKTTYYSKTPIDNISVLTSVYSNRMLLYSGDKVFSGEAVQINKYKALSLGIIGFFLNNNDPIIINNILVTASHIFSDKVKADRNSIYTEYDKLLSLMNIPSFVNKSKPFKHNAQLILANDINNQRKLFLKNNQDSVKLISRFTDDFINYKKYFSDNKEVYSTSTYNSTLELAEILQIYFPLNNYNNFENCLINLLYFFDQKEISEVIDSQNLKNISVNIISIKINNHAVTLASNNKTAEAAELLNAAITLLKKNGLNEKKSMQLLEQNYELLSKQLNKG